AQNIPIIEKIAAQSVSIETRYILRDENLELMDQFLTNDARSIPKLIALDSENHEVVGSWGSRPGPAQNLFYELKEKGIEKPLIMEDLQRWYNADRGHSIQKELAEFIMRGEDKQVSGARV
ncbi:MAG: thioredoxin family protein, partial [Candidatus Binatia bacterium]